MGVDKVIATIAQRKRKSDALPPRRNVASRIAGGFLPPINKLYHIHSYLMLERFGYTNLMVLAIGCAVLFFYVDFQYPSTLDKVLISLFGLTVMIHILRIMMIIVTKKAGK